MKNEFKKTKKENNRYTDMVSQNKCISVPVRLKVVNTFSGLQQVYTHFTERSEIIPR